MIYLFCNEGYGRAFIRAVQRYKANHRDFRVTLVFSSRTMIPGLSDGVSRKRVFIRRLRAVLLRLRKALRYRLPVLLVYDVNKPGFYDRISHKDSGIIAGFNQIFNENSLKRFKKMLNFHPSLLPYYRGPVPSYWCIKNRERFTGYTLHEVTTRVDDGEILFQEVVEIDGITDPEELDRKLAEAAALKLYPLLDSILYGGAFPVKSVDAAAFYARHIAYLSFPERND